MRPKVTRRCFVTSSVSLLGASLAVPKGWPAERRMGIKNVTRGAVLHEPKSTLEGQTWRYGLITVFQVAPRTAAAFCNIRLEYPPGGDLEVGTDVVLFDSLNSFGRTIIPVSRVHNEPNPNSKPPGKPAIILKYPVRGGFVPLGARRPDGSPHPHAGTGFGLLEALAAPIYTREEIRASVENLQDNLEPYIGAEEYRYLELQQYQYDGTNFRVTKSERLSQEELLPGWKTPGFGRTNAIPDGDDLLFGLNGQKRGSEHGAGIARWRRGSEGWRPISFVPVTGTDASTEASLIRDLDGSLLFAARGGREDTRNNLRVWRSANGGKAWKQVINVRGVLAGPIAINQAADGTPYVASNLYQVALFPLEPKWTIIVGPSLVRQGGWMRETLCFWPINENRSGVGTPMIVRDTRGEFGPPPDRSTWMCDHPSGAIVQLADGAWHSLIGYRIATRGEMTNYGSDPTPQSAAYLDEVHSVGEPVAIWKF